MKEIADAIAWYEEQQPGLGDRFRRATDQAYDTIVLSPLAYTKVRRNFRRFMIKDFPYGIIYEPKSDVIYVLSCFHSARNPKIWRKRL